MMDPLLAPFFSSPMITETGFFLAINMKMHKTYREVIIDVKPKKRTVIFWLSQLTLKNTPDPKGFFPIFGRFFVAIFRSLSVVLTLSGWMMPQCTTRLGWMLHYQTRVDAAIKHYQNRVDAALPEQGL